MEANLALILLEEVFNETAGKIYVAEMVTDDDSTIRSHCKNINMGGKLPDCIPQPLFLADPSHRIKVMAAPVFKLVSSSKDPDRVKNIDALRLKKYFSCYINQNRSISFQYFRDNAFAPAEHLFDNHEFCDAAWCWSKDLMEKSHLLIKTKWKRR